MATRQRPTQGAKGGELPVVLGALTSGLLASSCCIVQLVLNSLSIGCGGWWRTAGGGGGALVV